MLPVQAKRLMQETQFELWVPVNHANQLQHWTAATDALDHVILTAAALESVLEGMLVAEARGGLGLGLGLSTVTAAALESVLLLGILAAGRGGEGRGEWPRSVCASCIC